VRWYRQGHRDIAQTGESEMVREGKMVSECEGRVHRVNLLCLLFMSCFCVFCSFELSGT